MKKYIIIASIALLGFASCKKEEVEPITPPNICKVVSSKSISNGKYYLNYLNEQVKTISVEVPMNDWYNIKEGQTVCYIGFKD